MNAEVWDKVSQALDELLELPEPQRAAYLRKLRGQDPQVCREVESLLQQQLTGRLQVLPPSLRAEALAPTVAPQQTPAPGGACSRVSLLIEQRQSWQRGEPVFAEVFLQRH